MKKIITAPIIFLMLLNSFLTPSFASEKYPHKRENARVRDPFILVYEGKYYVYGTCLSNGEGYGCSVSEDLENWSDAIQIFSPDEDFDGCGDYWAPECHFYNGNFYLFATYKSQSSGKRGVGIFKSDSPTGPFVPIGDGHITPKDIDCIDGTLYVDEDGQPWMIYVNEWTTQPDGNGEMAAAKLSKDLTHFISEPIVLFRSNNHFWTDGNVTDGCFIYRTEKGKLIMLWSNFARSGGYAVGMALSDNGRPDGNWIHYPVPLYCKSLTFPLEGGHPMIFETLDGQKMLCLHSPNTYKEDLFETAQFIPVEEYANILKLVPEYENFYDTIKNFISMLIFEIILMFS